MIFEYVGGVGFRESYRPKGGLAQNWKMELPHPKIAQYDPASTGTLGGKPRQPNRPNLILHFHDWNAMLVPVHFC